MDLSPRRSFIIPRYFFEHAKFYLNISKIMCSLEIETYISAKYYRYIIFLALQSHSTPKNTFVTRFESFEKKKKEENIFEFQKCKPLYLFHKIYL